MRRRRALVQGPADRAGRGPRAGAVPTRADARDALGARDGLTLATLPEGARVGTGSPRRRAQLLAARPDLDVVDIRGNVDTRLGRLSTRTTTVGSMGSCSRPPASTVSAGSATHPNCSTSGAGPPHPAQGALALEIRADAPASLAERIGVVDHAPTHLAATAERGVLARLEAGCSAPIAAHATVVDGVITLTAACSRPTVRAS